jgi:4-hydroxybenzoate polyprenyltransferase
MSKIEGIRKNYPRIPVGEKLKAIVANARPFTLLLPIIGGWLMVEASLGRVTIPTPNVIFTWSAIFAMLLVNATSNYINSIFDVEIDRINKPYRPLPSGKLSETEAWFLYSLGILGAMLLAATVNLTFWLFTLASIGLGFVYSAPPLRLKKHLFWNGFDQALVRGLFGPLAMWSIFAPINVDILAFCAAMVTFVTAAQNIKDKPDVEGDRKFGMNTVMVLYGIKAVKEVIIVGTLAAMVELTMFAGLIKNGGVVALVFIPFAFAFAYTIGNAKKSLTENTIAWNLYYLAMVGLILGFLLAQLLPSSL